MVERELRPACARRRSWTSARCPSCSGRPGRRRRVPRGRGHVRTGSCASSRVHAARAGVAVGRVAADPPPRHGRRQPGHRLAGGGRVAGARRVRRRDRRSAGPAARRGTVAWRDFLVGVKRTGLRPDELILGARWRTPRGPGSFSKVGTRNAMVIAVAGLCLVVDEDARAVRVALGSVGPTVLRAPDAEAFAAAGRRRGRRVGRARGAPGRGGGPRVRRARRRRRAPDRRRARDRRVPPPRVRGHGRAGASVGDGRSARARARRGVSRMLVGARVNGEWREADVWPGASLLAYLRDGLHLFGTKNACEQGECGSCSVWLDGEVVCSCLVLAAQAQGRDVRTVESLGDDVVARARAARVRRRGRGAVRLLHAGAHRRRDRPAGQRPRPVGRGRARGARRATCAGAPATRRSSTPCAWPRAERRESRGRREDADPRLRGRRHDGRRRRGDRGRVDPDRERRRRVGGNRGGAVAGAGGRRGGRRPRAWWPRPASSTRITTCTRR